MIFEINNSGFRATLDLRQYDIKKVTYEEKENGEFLVDIFCDHSIESYTFLTKEKAELLYNSVREHMNKISYDLLED